MPGIILLDDFTLDAGGGFPAYVGARPGWTASRDDFLGNGYGAFADAGGLCDLVYPGTGAVHAYTANIGKADMYVRWVPVATSGPGTAIAFRYQDEGNWLGLLQVGATLYLMQSLAGVISYPQSVAEAATSGASYKVSSIGSAIVVTRNGTQIASWTHANLLGAKRAGFLMYGGSSTDALNEIELGYEGAPPQTIELSEPRLFYQRSSSTGLYSLTASGIYSGSPTSIRARLEYADGSVVPGFDWAVKVASPSANQFSFVMGGIPVNPATGTAGAYVLNTAKRYKLRVDYSNDATVDYLTETAFWVGDIIHIYGQSNAAGLLGGTALSPPVGSYYHTGSGYSPIAGLGMAEFAKRFVAETGVPLLLTNAAVANQSISALIDAGANWTAFLARNTAVGGDFAQMFWDQYEGDISGASPSAGYMKGKIEQLDGQLAALSAQYRRLLVTLGGRFEGLGELEAGGINRALKDLQLAAAQNARIKVSHSRRDLPQADNFHCTTDQAGYGEHGRRGGRSAASHIVAGVADGRGPVISTVSLLPGNKIRVVMDLNGSTALTVPASPTGWEVWTEEPMPVQINIIAGSFASVASDTFEFTLATAPTTNIRVYHMRGADPDNITLITGNLAA
jgi:hypothetical protein